MSFYRENEKRRDNLNNRSRAATMFSRHGWQWPLDEDEQMSITAREHLLDWLRDAHAIEKQAEQMLSAQIARLEHYPDLRRRLQQHLIETRTQCSLVDNCIERLGGDTSLIKDAVGKVVAMGQGLSGLFVGDEVIKGALASYAFEHMEIASYTMLIAAADAVDDGAYLQPDSQGRTSNGGMALHSNAQFGAGLSNTRRDTRRRRKAVISGTLHSQELSYVHAQ